jgi:sterol carrier protein 2
MKHAQVAGVGMIPFTKPGQSHDWDVMAETAVRLALGDAGVRYEQVQQAYAGYVYADSTAGQSALYRVGCTGIPVVNVNNNCSTGSTALYLARQTIESGAADCVLAFGFEQMLPGALGAVFGATGLAQCYELTRQLRGTAEARQVEDARFALQHNIGLGGACVVTLYGAA